MPRGISKKTGKPPPHIGVKGKSVGSHWRGVKDDGPSVEELIADGHKNSKKRAAAKRKRELTPAERQKRSIAGRRGAEKMWRNKGRTLAAKDEQVNDVFNSLGIDESLRFKPPEAPAPIRVAEVRASSGLDDAQRAELEQYVAAARRLAQRKAKDSLIEFTRYTMPSPDDPADVELSRYDPLFYHRAVADALEAMERGEILRLIIVMPPRHGKSELTTRRFVPWFVGRDPYRSVITASYSDQFAEDFGRDVRAIMQHPSYGQVFPGVALRSGSQASDRLQTTEGGLMFFVGRGGATTGRGADLIGIDDPLKDDEEAQSPTIREKLWQWFTKVLTSRLLSQMGRILITTTRWHEDDLVGRLTDPRNIHFRADEAEKWSVLHLPALAEDNDALGRKKGEALWPSHKGQPKFDVKFLEGQRRLNPNGFSALYQGRPSPEEGVFFKRKDLVPYTSILQLPDRDTLRFYGASDHAVGEKQKNDRSCIGCVAVDQNDDIWILPDVVWDRIGSELAVEVMIDQLARYRPMYWWAEDENISKSIGPFLNTRMRERKIYGNIEPVRPSKDKMRRAQAIKARFSMRKVHVPTFAAWWSEAEDELLKFPNAAYDDFVDWIAHIGMGLDRLISIVPQVEKKSGEPARGTSAWVVWQARRERAGRLLIESSGGY